MNFYYEVAVEYTAVGKYQNRDLKYDKNRKRQKGMKGNYGKENGEWADATP